MSPSGISFLIGFFAIFLAERMFGGNDVVRWSLLGLGGLLSVGAVALRATTMQKHAAATKTALGFYLLALLSLALYVAGGKDMVDGMGLSTETSEQVRTALQALAPLVWLIGALPALAIDRTLYASPKSVHPRRLQTAVEGGLALAFGIGMLFPMNWLAKEYNERFDYGFFKTTAVGESTRSIVDNLTEPIRVVLFFPPSSEVLREVEPYFNDLEGPNVSLEIMDHAMAPELAKDWKVKDNGNVVFVRGEAVEVVKLGDKIDGARKELRKLDSKVQTALLKLARDKRTAYFTVGHEEAYWKGAASDLENTDTMKKAVESLNFKVKELGVDDGLAQAVPDDAAVVFITGPKRPFLDEEIKALQEYRDRGGAVFLMLEPTDTPDPALAALFGVTYTSKPVLSDKAFLRVTGGLSDRAFIGTSKFSSHESVTTLSKNAAQATFITPISGAVKETEGDHTGKVTVTVKGMPDWFADDNGNYEFDKDTEKRGAGYDLAAVVAGPSSGDKEWRAAVVADASWASNTFIRNAANAYYLVDTLGWLTQDPALSGEVETEEDVKIQHTKEGESVWFYGTSALVPALVFLGGLVRVNSRRRKGAL
ncbi:MAG: Gldg family protein [Pseudomonadota bacterium]|nr:Gldg family protein [Pseudomonadota bacterium]